MRYVALIKPGPSWIEGKPISEQDRTIAGAHLVSMRRHYDNGAVLLGGPFASGYGGIALLEAADETAARAIMDADPAVKAGVMAYDLNAVRTFFDAFAGTAWSPPVSG